MLSRHQTHAHPCLGLTLGKNVYGFMYLFQITIFAQNSNGKTNLEGAYSSVNLYNSKTVQILMLCLFQKNDTFFAQCVYFISDLDFLSIDSKLSIFWASRKPIIGQWYVDSNHNNWWLLLGYCYKYKIMILSCCIL